MLPLVSVIIPGYKDKFILETIESILQQTYENIEILVVDDGSPNDLENKLSQYISDNKIRYIYQNNQKMAAARNNGIRHSTGSLIAFLDDDDLWLPSKIEKQVKYFENDDVGLVYTFADGFNENKKIPIKNFRIKHEGKIFDKIFLQDFIANSSVIIRKSCLNKVGLFKTDIDYFGVDDADMWTRISYYFEARCIDELLTLIRLHDEQFSNQKSKMYKNDLTARKHLINDLVIPVGTKRKYFQRIYFEMGYSARKENKTQSFKYYIKSFTAYPSITTLLAILKLPLN